MTRRTAIQSLLAGLAAVLAWRPWKGRTEPEWMGGGYTGRHSLYTMMPDGSWQYTNSSQTKFDIHGGLWIRNSTVGEDGPWSDWSPL